MTQDSTGQPTRNCEVTTTGSHAVVFARRSAGTPAVRNMVFSRYRRPSAASGTAATLTMRLTEKIRKLFAVGFMAGIGTVGVQDVDADGSTDFTVRGTRRPLVERPVERDDPDGDASPFCVLDIETTGFSPKRDSIIEIAVIRRETEDGITRERVLNAARASIGEHPEA